MTSALRAQRPITLVALALAVLGLVGLLSLRDVARADYPPSGGCAVSTTTTNSGKAVVTGSGFAANSRVVVRAGSRVVATGTSDSTGAFRMSVAQSDAASGVSATVGNTTCNQGSGTDPLTLHRGVGDPGARAATATTGFAAISTTAVALLLLVAGAAFVLIGRRRRIN